MERLALKVHLVKFSKQGGWKKFFNQKKCFLKFNLENYLGLIMRLTSF